MIINSRRMFAELWRHRLTSLIIEHFHRIYFHPVFKRFIIYLILPPKSTIRNVVSKCLKCWRLNPTKYEPEMGNLPKMGISQIKLFSCVEVDFAGPTTITRRRIHGANMLKSYICVFVCFSTKAIHPELTSDLSSKSFLAAFRRFIERRVRCSKVFSDCSN